MTEGEGWRHPLHDIRLSAKGVSPRKDILIKKYKNLRFSEGDLLRLFIEIAKFRSAESCHFDPLDLFIEIVTEQHRGEPSDLERRIITCLSNGFSGPGTSRDFEVVRESLKSGKDKDSLDELILAVWMGEEPSAILEFPVASVFKANDEDEGMITTMRLRVWKQRSPGILRDFEHYNRNVANVFEESAKFALELSGATGLISWSIPELEAESYRGDGKLPEIAGPSRSAAIARALWLHQHGKKVDRRLLVIGQVIKGGHLAAVGDIREKTKAAISFTKKAIEDGKKPDAKFQEHVTIPIDRIAIVGRDGVKIARSVIAEEKAGHLIDVVELDSETVITSAPRE